MAGNHRDPSSWAGVFPAPLTLFDANGELDEDGTAEHLDWLIGQGAHGLLVAGTSGEFIGMTDPERRRVIDIAVDVASGRVPVIAGTGHYSTRATIDLTRYAETAGADGVVVVLPYFQRPSRVEILGHYRAVAAATDLAVMVYNIPANAATDPVSVADLGALYRDGVARAVKSTLPTVHQLQDLRNELGDGFRAFYGGTTAPLEALAGGAHGWISGVLNVTTATAVRVWDAIGKSDLDSARQAWTEMLPIRNLVTTGAFSGVSDLAVYRGVLRVLGRPAGYCRAPLRDLDSDQTSMLEKLLA